MATYSIEYERNLRRIIRDIKALDPLITNVALPERLSERFNHSFDREYVTKLGRKVERELMVEVNRATIEQRLKFTRENYRVVRDRLCEIIYWQPDPENSMERRPANKDLIEAAKTIVMFDIAVLNAEISNGAYKKPIDVMAQEIRYQPLPPGGSEGSHYP